MTPDAWAQTLSQLQSESSSAIAPDYDAPDTLGPVTQPAFVLESPSPLLSAERTQLVERAALFIEETFHCQGAPIPVPENYASIAPEFALPSRWPPRYLDDFIKYVLICTNPPEKVVIAALLILGSYKKRFSYWYRLKFGHLAFISAFLIAMEQNIDKVYDNEQRVQISAGLLTLEKIKSAEESLRKVLDSDFDDAIQRMKETIYLAYETKVQHQASQRQQLVACPEAGTMNTIIQRIPREPPPELPAKHLDSNPGPTEHAVDHKPVPLAEATRKGPRRKPPPPLPEDLQTFETA